MHKTEIQEWCFSTAAQGTQVHSEQLPGEGALHRTDRKHSNDLLLALLGSQSIPAEDSNSFAAAVLKRLIYTRTVALYFFFLQR